MGQCFSVDQDFVFAGGLEQRGREQDGAGRDEIYASGAGNLGDVYGDEPGVAAAWDGAVGTSLKVGVFQTGLLYGFMYIGYANVTGMKASVLSQSGIFIVIVLAAFFLHEKVGRFQWIGLAIGIAGILVVNVNQLGDRATLFTFTMNGEGAMILAGLFGSIGSVLARIHGKNFSPMILNGWQMTFGGLMLLCVGVVMNGGLVELPSLLSIVLFVHTIVVASVGFTLWYSLLKRVEIKEIVLYRLTIPVLGSVFSAMFLAGEDFDLFLVLGLGLVALGMYVKNLGLTSLKRNK